MAETNGVTTETTNPATAETTKTEPEVKAEQTNGDNVETKAEENGSSATNEEESGDSPPKLFVGRLPAGTKENQLKELFGAHGEVTHCDIVGKYGFIHMKNKDEADAALKVLNNHSFNGSNITVQLSTSTAKKVAKKKQNRTTKKPFNTPTTNNNSNNNLKNKRVAGKNGFTPNKNQLNVQRRNGNNNGTNGNNNASGNNRNTNGNFNRPNRGNRQFNNRPMNRPSIPPFQSGYYSGDQPAFNSFYPPSQMQPAVCPPPRDMYYNRPPENQYYRPNQVAPQTYNNGMNMMQPQPVQQNYYTQPYSRVSPVSNLGPPAPQQVAPQQQMYPMQMGPINTNPQPSGLGYQVGYGNDQMANNKFVNGSYQRNGYQNKGRPNMNLNTNNSRFTSNNDNNMYY